MHVTMVNEKRRHGLKESRGWCMEGRKGRKRETKGIIILKRKKLKKTGGRDGRNV